MATHWRFKTEKDISIQNFFDLFLNGFLSPLTELQSKMYKWERLVVETIGRREHLKFSKTIRGLYGKLDDPADISKGFQFVLHPLIAVSPKRLFLRGVPDVFSRFDAEGNVYLSERVDAVEKLFMNVIGSEKLNIRYQIPIKRNKQELEYATITYIEGIHLRTFLTIPNKKKGNAVKESKTIVVRRS